LLQRAADDATLVRHVVENPDIADAIVGFHAQQAVEKSIKAVLAACDIEYGKTHQLNYLIGLLAEGDIDLPSPVIEADELSPWAVEFRYETDSEPALDRPATLQLIEDIWRWADGKVKATPAADPRPGG
jgi:HEPN domain-containing protein